MIDTEPRQQITPAQKTAALRDLCSQMWHSETHCEQILEQMGDLIRAPTTTLFGEGM